MTEAPTQDYQSQLDNFRTLCQRHDLTYSYSDDNNAWKRGSQERATIEAFAKHLKREDAVRIWNEVVDKKVSAPHNKQFHWK